jgi:hypothetical protein
VRRKDEIENQLLRLKGDAKQKPSLYDLGWRAGFKFALEWMLR